jgi:HK97 gp10 family phage protein
MARLETKGFAEWMERIAQAGRDVDQVAGQALEEGAEVLLEGMRKRVPKDTHNLEENLERTEVRQDGNVSYVDVGLSKDADAKTARYGNAQEYGSSNMQAQPYIRPTLDEDMSKARKAMRAVFEKALGEQP